MAARQAVAIGQRRAQAQIRQLGQRKVVTITVSQFRGMDSLSGEMRVEGGSRTRRGVRRHRGQASCKSPEALAGTAATSGAAAGESAHTSAAHAASSATDADPADVVAKSAGNIPKKKSKKGGAARAAGGGNDDGGPGNQGETAPKMKPPEEQADAVESLWQEKAQLDGGDPLPEDGPAFVDCVNDHIDLVRTTELLLRGRDDKSSKSLLELLLEMKYGKGAAGGGPENLIRNLSR